MNYEELSDRELDALVAENVMYWVSNGRDFWCHDHSLSDKSKCAEHFQPTTDANCRDQVVERMRELGWWVRIVSGYGPGDPFNVRFTPHNKGETEYAVDGHQGNAGQSESQGRALAIAALKALEAKS